MTQIDHRDVGTDASDGQPTLTRRQLREQLRQQRDEAPKSIFDLEYEPYGFRFFDGPAVSDAETDDEAAGADSGEAAAELPQQTASRLGAGFDEELDDFADEDGELSEAELREFLATNGAGQPSAPPVPAPVASQAVTAPPKTAVPKTVVPKIAKPAKATRPAKPAKPAKAQRPAKPAKPAPAPAIETPVENPLREKRSMVGRVLASVAALGLVATFALPALAGNTTEYAGSADGQVLWAGSASPSTFDPESFESVDELEVAAEAATLRADTFTNNPNGIVQYPFSHGVPLTDGFGPRSFPVAGFHDAQDFAAGYGAAVRAIAAGTVLESGPTSDGCGFGLKLSHIVDGDTVESRYCHLASTPVVAVGDTVAAGQFVAVVGSTGISFGPHLHLVIQVNGNAVDPMPYLAKYNKVVAPKAS